MSTSFSATTAQPLASRDPNNAAEQQPSIQAHAANLSKYGDEAEPALTRFEAKRQQEIEKIGLLQEDMLERLNWQRSQIEEEQLCQLRKTLAYAKEHSRFYAKRLAHIDPETFQLSDMETIPVLTKADVMENWDDIVTDPDLTLAEANKHLAQLRDGKSDNYFYKDKYFLCATGGSSGYRGLFIWDEETFRITTALCFRMEAAHDKAHPQPQGVPKRTALICAGSYLHGSRMVFLQSPFDKERKVKAYQAGLPIHQLVADLNEYQPDRIISFTSTVEQLCHEAQAGRLQLKHINRISVNSEPLEQETRDMVKELWGIDICNAWGCVDVGITGVEGDHSEGMALAEDCLIFEAANAQGQIISGEQEPADHLIVTKLFGNTLPMIRYKMTDSVSITSKVGKDAPHYRRVTQVHGRADVWFSYNDNTVQVHPMVFRSVLGQYAPIIEYQVRQTVHGAEIDLLVAQNNVNGDLDIAKIAKDLTHKLEQAGLLEPKLDIQVVEQLRRHPESNKLTRFVQLAPKQKETQGKEEHLLSYADKENTHQSG